MDFYYRRGLASGDRFHQQLWLGQQWGLLQSSLVSVDDPICVYIRSRTNSGSVMSSLHWMIDILTVKIKCSQD
jgi:hypothetical protein